jgi:hypothetical protein
MAAIIFSINLIGINYAQWNGGMKIKTDIKTGIMDAKVVTLSVSGAVLQGTRNTDSTLNISGSMVQGQTATVNYSVNNSGTLPIKFEAPIVVEKNGLMFDLSSAVKNIDGKIDSTTSSGQFNIIACQSGDYQFTVELPYTLDVQ